MNHSATMQPVRLRNQLLSVSLMLGIGMAIATTFMFLISQVFSAMENFSYGLFESFYIEFWGFFQLPTDLAFIMFAVWCASAASQSSNNLREWRFFIFVLVVVLMIQTLFNYGDPLVSQFSGFTSVLLLGFICFFIFETPLPDWIKKTFYGFCLVTGIACISLTAYDFVQSVFLSTPSEIEATDDMQNIWQRIRYNSENFITVFHGLACLWMAHIVKPYPKLARIILGTILFITGLAIASFLVPAIFDSASINDSRLWFLRALSIMILIEILIVFMITTLLNDRVLKVPNGFRTA